MKEPETGKKENTGKSGYSITTWRLHLWCRHPEWLRTTQEFYNRIAEFYYNLLLDHTDLWELGSQQTLRELEIMSIPGRGGRIPSDPLPWQKVQQLPITKECIRIFPLKRSHCVSGQETHGPGCIAGCQAETFRKTPDSCHHP